MLPGEHHGTTTLPPFGRSHRRLLVALTGLGFALRIVQLGQESLWFDETLSALFAAQPVGIAIRSMLEEGLHHSPLYYLLLRPFAAGGLDEFSLRFFSLLLGVLAIPLLAQLGRVLASPRVGLLAAALLAVNPFHIWYSRETRMYTLLFVAAAGAMFFFSRVVVGRSRLGDWLGLALCTAVGVNTHHFAHHVWLTQFLFLLVTLRQTYPLLRRWVLAMLLAALSFIPWLLIVVNWGQFFWASAAHGRPGPADLLSTLWNFSIGYTVRVTPYVIAALLLVGLVLLAGLARRTRARPLLLLWLLVPPLLTFAVSMRFPMYLDRYLIVALPPFLLLLALGLDRLPAPALRLAAAAVVVALMAGGTYRLYTDDGVYERADWRAAGAYLAQNADPERDRLLTLYYQELIPLGFYYDAPLDKQAAISFSTVSLPELPAVPGETGKLWFVIGYPNSSAHLVGHCQAFDMDSLTSSPEVRAWRARNQSRLTAVHDCTCIRIETYE